jgi:hypothetical protein
MYRKFFAWIQKYERHLSALAMVAGFVCDNMFFTRIDIERTQILLAIYAVACFVSIPLLHFIEARVERGRPRPRWRFLLPLTTQFALGGFWSAFVIFYSRSAVFSASWPFLILLFLIFLASEYFHKYHARLVFTSTLFFFALYSCAIFEVPIYTGTLGTWTFLESGAVAVCIFALFTILLRILGRERFLADVKKIRIGALGVLVVINLAYFTNILPPLPLSAMTAGIYHSVTRVPGAYLVTSENEPWQVQYLGFEPTLHIVSGESLYAFSSVFAPTTLTTTIVHRWQWYDSTKNEWLTKAVIKYPIVGGRNGGYGGYSDLPISSSGQWRVDVETVDGLIIARLPFVVEMTATEPVETTVILN